MSDCVNLLKNSIQNNKKGFLINKNSKNINLLKSLLKLNLIKFIIIKNNKILVMVNYKNNRPIFKNIINMYKSGNKLYIRYSNLKKMNEKHNWILILSTSKGIISSLDALKMRVGGLLIAKLWN